MGAKLTANTSLVNPETHEVETLLAGQELPDWAEGLVGDHMLKADKDEDDDGKVTKTAPKK